MKAELLMVEREMQELLWQHPERFFNEPLKQIAWEAASEVGRADLVFEDRHGRLLIIEVKRGKLPRGAIGQLQDYFGMMKQKYPGKPVEMMVVACTIPTERKLACEHYDIEWREFSERLYREVATDYGYVFESERQMTDLPVVEPPPPPPPQPPTEAEFLKLLGENAGDDIATLAEQAIKEAPEHGLYVKFGKVGPAFKFDDTASGESFTVGKIDKDGKLTQNGLFSQKCDVLKIPSDISKSYYDALKKLTPESEVRPWPSKEKLIWLSDSYGEWPSAAPLLRKRNEWFKTIEDTMMRIRPLLTGPVR
jgi:hypothetical protein